MSMWTRKFVLYPMPQDHLLEYLLLFLYLKSHVSQYRYSKCNHAETCNWGVSFPWSSSLSSALGEKEMQLGSQIAVYWLSMESWHIPHMIFIFSLKRADVLCHLAYGLEWTSSSCLHSEVILFFQRQARLKKKKRKYKLKTEGQYFEL